MIPEETWQEWRGMFMRRIERRNRREAFAVLENLRGLMQMPINKPNDAQIEDWFNWLAIFNQTFPDNPVYFAE